MDSLPAELRGLLEKVDVILTYEAHGDPDDLRYTGALVIQTGVIDFKSWPRRAMVRLFVKTLRSVQAKRAAIHVRGTPSAHALNARTIHELRDPAFNIDNVVLDKKKEI